MTGSRRALLIVLLVAAGISAIPAAADWLVLRDGGAIETSGTWEVEGRLVLFHRTDGSLASMRLSEVDIEQSHRRTVAARAPKPEAPVEPQEEIRPVLVLTDADVAHVDPSAFLAPEEDAGEGVDDEAADGEEGEGQDEGSKDGRVPTAGAVEVTGWHSVSDMEFAGARIGGTIRNTSEEVALNIVLTARLTDENGRVLGSSRADLRRRALEPGASTSFAVDFSGVYTYTGIDFEVQSFDAVRRQGEE